MVQPADAAKEISRLSREMERLYHELSLKKIREERDRMLLREKLKVK